VGFSTWYSKCTCPTIDSLRKVFLVVSLETDKIKSIVVVPAVFGSQGNLSVNIS
jgi:hypothetical protein